MPSGFDFIIKCGGADIQLSNNDPFIIMYYVLSGVMCTIRLQEQNRINFDIMSTRKLSGFSHGFSQIC